MESLVIFLISFFTSALIGGVVAKILMGIWLFFNNKKV